MMDSNAKAEHFYNVGPLNLWGPVQPNSLNTPKCGPARAVHARLTV